MAPSDQTEMPWTPSATQIKGRLLEAFASSRLDDLRGEIRSRMPVVEVHEVRWTEESDEDADDGDGVSEESSPRESLGALIESVHALPDLCFFEKVAVEEEGDDKSASISGETSPRLATEFRQVNLDVPADDHAGNTTPAVRLAERDEAAVPPFSF